MPEPTPDRPETLQERISTIIQEGHIKGETSFDTAGKIIASESKRVLRATNADDTWGKKQW